MCLCLCVCAVAFGFSFCPFVDVPRFRRFMFILCASTLSTSIADGKYVCLRWPFLPFGCNWILPLMRLKHETMSFSFVVLFFFCIALSRSPPISIYLSLFFSLSLGRHFRHRLSFVVIIIVIVITYYYRLSRSLGDLDLCA